MRKPFVIQNYLLFALATALLTLSVHGTSHGQRQKKIYWTEWNSETQTGRVRRAQLNGSYVKDVVTGLQDPRSIALDTLRRKVYWVDDGTGKIQRADFTGRNIQNIVIGFKIGADGQRHVVCDENGCKGDAFPHKGGRIDVPHELLIHPYGLAIAPDKGKIYWGNDLRGTIQTAALNGSDKQDILDIGIDIPTDFVIAVGGDKLYWKNVDRKARSDKIQRSNLDGSGVEDIVTGLRGPHGIALDMRGRKIYWTTHTTKIQRANLDGSHVEDVIIGLTDVGALALDPLAGKIYWVSHDIDTNVSKIQRANLDGSRVRDVIRGLGHVSEIALYIPGAYTVNPGAAQLTTRWAEIK